MKEMSNSERLVRAIDPLLVGLLDEMQKTDEALDGKDWRGDDVPSEIVAFLLCIKEYGDRREAAAHDQYLAGTR